MYGRDEKAPRSLWDNLQISMYGKTFPPPKLKHQREVVSKAASGRRWNLAGRHTWWEFKRRRQGLSGGDWVTDEMQLETQPERERERRGRLVSSSYSPVFAQCLLWAKLTQVSREQRSLGSVVLWDTEQSTEGREYPAVNTILENLCWPGSTLLQSTIRNLF